MFVHLVVIIWCVYMIDCKLYVFCIIPGLNYSFADRVPPYQRAQTALFGHQYAYYLSVVVIISSRVNHGVSFCKLLFSFSRLVRSLIPMMSIPFLFISLATCCEGRICRYSKPVKSQQLAFSESPITMVTTCLSVL